MLVAGQTPAPNPAPIATPTAEVSAREAPITFSSRVNLVMVPVIVRNGMGRAIGNLRIDDFQLFDKGKPQVITRFSVERPSSPFIPAVVATPLEEEVKDAALKARPPQPIPERFIAYVFDDLHLKAEDLLPTRQA